MVMITVDLPEKLNVKLEIYNAKYQFKDKRKAIIDILSKYLTKEI